MDIKKIRKKIDEHHEDILGVQKRAKQFLEMVHSGILTDLEAATVYSSEVNQLRRKIGLKNHPKKVSEKTFE